MVHDILDAFVAAGTLALAVVTGCLAFMTRGSVRESYRARIDAFGQRVFVRSFAVDRHPVSERLVNERYQDPHPLDPGTTWLLEPGGKRMLGLKASATIQNEGTHTALIHVEHPSEVELLRQRVPTHPDDTVEPRIDAVGVQNSDWYLIPPGETLPADVIWWRHERDWVADAKRGGATPAILITLVFCDQTGLAVDRCQLTFGGYVLWPSPTGTTWFVALRSEPTPVETQAPSPVASIGSMEREWPGEQRRGSPPWLRWPGKVR